MKLTDAQWEVMDVLWSGECFSLIEIEKALKSITGWSKNTVYTYLVRMEAKGMVTIDKQSDKPYRAAISKAACEKEERQSILHRVYKGKTGDLICAFIKDSDITKEEIAQLRQLLDEMEV